MINRTGIAIAAALLLSGCSVRQWYTANLTAHVQEDAPVAIELKPVGYWLEFMGSTRIDEASDPMAFTLVNKLPQPITVEWDRCAFVDDRGVSHRVIHAGVRLMSRDQAQPPSVVGPGGRIEDLILPVDYVAMVGGRWINRVYFPTEGTATAKGSYVFLLGITVDGKSQLLNIPIELKNISTTRM